jgi:hypothetical protein
VCNKHKLNSRIDINKLRKGVGLLILLIAEISFAELADPTEPQEFYGLRKDNGNKIALQSNFRLTEVMLRGNQYMAVINDKMVFVGDKIADSKVLAIDPYSVKLSGKNGDITLKIFGPTVKEISK